MVDIQVTKAAQDYFAQYLAKTGAQAIRLSIKKAGCSGFGYVLEDVNEPCEGDLQASCEGEVLLYVDADAYDTALKGLCIDFQQDVLSSGLVYSNPNQQGVCGCGESFTL